MKTGNKSRTNGSGAEDNDKFVWILGTPYKETKTAEIRKHSRSLFRITYRRDFPAMNPYSLTSDAGWGCMIRSAQMMMATAFSRHYLGAGWRLSNDINVRRNTTDYIKILTLFLDVPGDAACMYAIHNIVQSGIQYDKLPGEWFGPSTAALALRDLARLHRRQYNGPIDILVANGDTIYMSEVERICTFVPEPSSSSSSSSAGYGSGPPPSAEAMQNSSELGSATIELRLLLAISSPSPPSSANTENPNHATTELEEPSRGTGIAANTPEDGIITSVQPCHPPVHAVITAGPAAVGGCTANVADNGTTNAGINISRPTSKSPASAGLSKYDLQAEINNRIRSRARAVLEQTTLEERASKWNPALFFDPLYNPPPQEVKPWQCSIIVLVPVRLGINGVNPEYVEELKELLRNKYSLGFIGGRVNHAIYFVGYKGQSTLLGLDPHTTFASVPKPHAGSTAPFPSDELISQIHVNALEELDISRLDPSLCIGFYFNNREEFEAFTAQCRKDNAAKLKSGRTPIVYVEYAAPSYVSACEEEEDDEEHEGGSGGLASSSMTTGSGDGGCVCASPEVINARRAAASASASASAGGGTVASNASHSNDENDAEQDVDDEYVML